MGNQLCRLNGELFLCDEVGDGQGLGIQDIIIRWYFSHMPRMMMAMDK